MGGTITALKAILASVMIVAGTLMSTLYDPAGSASACHVDRGHGLLRHQATFHAPRHRHNRHSHPVHRP